MLLLQFFVFTLAFVRRYWASYIEAATNPGDFIEKGIPFIEDSEFLLTENFIRVEFFVPFPTYEFTKKPDIEKMVQQNCVNLMWEYRSLLCSLKFLSQIAINTSRFNGNWTLHHVDHKIFLAQQDLAPTRNETALFLTPHLKSTRQRH